MSKKPDDTLRDGNIKATIWGRDFDREDGRAGRLFNVQIAKSYKDKDGEWHETNQFGEADLLPVSRLSEKAYDRVAELRATWADTRKNIENKTNEIERDR